MTSPGTTSVISSTGAPINCANAATDTLCPSPSRGTIATRPDRITYIPETASPARNRNAPAGNRLTSPKRRTRPISVSDRTGNIWSKRDPNAALAAADSAGIAFSTISWRFCSSSIGMSDPRHVSPSHVTSTHAMRVRRRSQGQGNTSARGRDCPVVLQVARPGTRRPSRRLLRHLLARQRIPEIHPR